ncbi:MAG: bifunctional riboflavin kinase/FAD synthetase [Gemmatimonadetes bacterium]|nr:bifunctional riboflavin kinase/FAD synthetase [Gemmatimonadota bacterium]
MTEERVLSGPSGLPDDVLGTAVTVGSFDGVHRGHLVVLAQLVAYARAHDLASLLVTFDPHPLEVVNPAAAPPLLTVGNERLEVLAESGIDYVAVLPFTADLQRLAADEFVDQVLRERFRMRALLMGHDHGFGRNRSGDLGTMQALGATRGFAVEVIAPVATPSGRPVSSTAIRRAIAGGDLDHAAEGLGRPYAISGIVVHGDQRGRALGFRTLNVALPSSRKLLPPAGVYAVRVQTPRGPYGGMMNLGPRPTFGDDATTLEAHLFDVDGDFYGMPVRVDVIKWLRGTRQFDGPAALVAQLREDEVQARAALTPPGRPATLQGSPDQSPEGT